MIDIPTVFVSSTCFDLQQVRADLSQFIEDELGYRALLSNRSAFPVNPDMSTIENCRRAVEQADIFVLIVGGRYGCVDEDTSKSITNLEYLTATANAIPIYAFVEKRILALLPAWESNKTANFAGLVDNPELFEFITRVRAQDKVWVFPFETAQGITETLRAQFAYRVAEMLQLMRRMDSRDLARKLEGLSGKALRLALDQPDAWEYRLFGQVIAEEIEKHRDLRQRHMLSLALGPGDYVPSAHTLDWLMSCLAHLKRSATALNTLVNTAVQDAFGPPGQPGDPGAIVFVAQSLGNIYADAIEWSQRILRTYVDPLWQPAAESLSAFANNIIEEIEIKGLSILPQIEAALTSPDKCEVVITFNVDIDPSTLVSFGREVDKAAAQFDATLSRF